MTHPSQRGHINALLIPLILMSLFFVASAVAAGLFYSSRQDYKNNSDKKVAAAVAVAQKETSTKKDNEFAETIKKPLAVYHGPSPFGSLAISYPKTWSAYVNEDALAQTPVDAYFHPGFVPATTSNASYALRAQITNTSYADSLKNFDAAIKGNKLKATPYTPPNVPSVTGVRLEGALTPLKNGVMVLLPLRDKSLKIWTESSDFTNDFNNNVLPNFTYAN